MRRSEPAERPGARVLALAAAATIALVGAEAAGAQGGLDPARSRSDATRVLDGPGFAGFAVNHRADLNADGHPDLVVGAPAASPHGTPNAGAVFVLFGPGAGSVDLTALGGRGVRIDGIEPGANLGRTVADGDVNGDGVDDLIITAPALGAEGYRTPKGGTYVVFGGRDLPRRMDVRRLGRRGFSINVDATDATSGDVNGDGVDDVVVGAGNALRRRGAAIVVFGSRSPSAQGNVRVARDIFRTEATSYFRPAGARGFWLGPNLHGRGAIGLTTAAGDVNGDGFDDVILGAPESSHRRRRECGTVFVVFGRRAAESGFLPTIGARQGFRVLGSHSGDRAGRAVAASDLDGDGVDELVVGAPGAAVGGRGRAGEVFVVHGRRELPSGVVDLARWWQEGVARIVGGSRSEQAGTEIAVADLEGDGSSDLLVGAPQAARGSIPAAGRVYRIADPPGDGESLDLGAPGGAGGELFAAEDIEVAGVAVDATDATATAPAQVLIGAPLAGTGSLESLGRAYVVVPGDAATRTAAAAPPSAAAPAAGRYAQHERGTPATSHARRPESGGLALRRRRLTVHQPGRVAVIGTCNHPKGCLAQVELRLDARGAGQIEFSPASAAKVRSDETEIFRLRALDSSWPSAWRWIAGAGKRGRVAIADITVLPLSTLLSEESVSPLPAPDVPVVLVAAGRG